VRYETYDSMRPPLRPQGRDSESRTVNQRDRRDFRTSVYNILWKKLAKIIVHDRGAGMKTRFQTSPTLVSVWQAQS